MINQHAFAAAERLAPMPATRAEATVDAWVRHYAAQSLAAFAVFENHTRDLSGAKEGSRPDLGYLVALGVASMSVAVAFTPTAPMLWDLTPEAGALNGEWEEWLTETLDSLGINPADIDPRYSAADFRSPSAAQPAASPTFNPAYRVARCGLLRVHAPHVVESGPDQPRNCPGYDPRTTDNSPKPGDAS